MWKIRVTDSAERQLKRYRHSPDFIRFEKAIHELQQAEDPTRLGTFKILNDLRCFSYRVTDSLRLLYSVDGKANLLIIHGLGDHKAVYGSD